MQKCQHLVLHHLLADRPYAGIAFSATAMAKQRWYSGERYLLQVVCSRTFPFVQKRRKIMACLAENTI